MGDERTYERAVALRAVTSTDAMTADWAHLPYDFLAKVSNDIIRRVRGVNRVCYDVSSKPPATIEWEYPDVILNLKCRPRKTLISVAFSLQWNYNFFVIY